VARHLLPSQIADSHPARPQDAAVCYLSFVDGATESMEARLFRAAALAAAFLSLGADHPTRNFVVTATSPQLAREIAETAESCRKTLAIEWLGKELPPWGQPCQIVVNVGSHLGAGGATSFMFDNGRPFGWSMNIQGSRERLLDSVVPHEVTHMIFATHYGRPLPRWADEGACTTVEHPTERAKQQQLLISHLTTGRGIAFNQMFAMSEYPRDILPLYAQGYSLARFLIARGGRRRFVDYVGDGMRSNNWHQATQKHYGLKDLSDLQVTWLDWVRRGSPSLALPASETLVAQQSNSPGNEPSPARATAGHEQQAVQPQPGADDRIAANVSSQGGWYARLRDQAAVRRGETEVLQAVSRPQPPVQPQQVTLEPIQPFPAPPAAITAQAPSSSRSSPAGYLAPAPTGTFWR